MRISLTEFYRRALLLAFPGPMHDKNHAKIKSTKLLCAIDQRPKRIASAVTGAETGRLPFTAFPGHVSRGALIGAILTAALAFILGPMACAQSYTFAEALNATDLVWMADTSDDTSWIVQTAVTHDGVAAAKCVPHVGTCGAKIHTTVTGPGSLTFWFRFGSGPALGTWLEVVLQEQGGVPRHMLYGGSTQWSQGGMTIDEGICDLHWGVVVQSTPEAVFLDQVQFTPSVSATIEGLTIVKGKARVKFSAPVQLASSFRLLSATQLSGPWAINSAAVLSTNAADSFTFTAPLHGSSSQFYRVEIAAGQ